MRPFQIENRSNSHYLQFNHIDPKSAVIEVSPMSFWWYDWYNPLGKFRLQFIAIDKHKSKEYLCKQAESPETEIHEDSSEYESNDIATEIEWEDDITIKKSNTSNKYVSSHVATIIKGAVPPHSMWTHSNNASKRRKALK